MTASSLPAALLLLGSGMCGLIYQMVWFQQLRLTFGTSTAASAAVTAIFMAGLGLGSRLLGRRADMHSRPLVLYGRLEVGIAVCAALSPLLMSAVRSIYLSTGGTMTFGMFLGTALRGLLALLVLGLPTFLMGGTFPAVARATSSDGEAGRTGLGLLYAANTFGAVAGVLAGTFYLVERFGLQHTLYLTCTANLLVGGIAWLYGMMLPEVPIETTPKGDFPGTTEDSSEPVSLRLIGGAAFLTGATFFLLEMVWYRMLAPLLGGSTYSFGLILAVALLGIGLGGLAFFFRPSREPATLGGFALATAVQTFVLAVPIALGDSIAILTGLIGIWDTFGFGGKLLAWSVIAGIVVFPAALVSGFQFPMLLSLAGRGRAHVGRQVGNIYAMNTLGAVTGSIAGGFGLLSLLSAPGCWRMGIVLVGLLSLWFIAAAIKYERLRLACILPLVFCGLGLFLLGSVGPTAAWRHSGVGFGRADLVTMPINAIREWRNIQRRSAIWEADGRESSVALTEANGLAFSINGKCDGNSIEDAPTQIMLGMVSALHHPSPKSAFVIGLGTGCSAGWLGAIPQMEQVVVAELEPMVLEVARRCSPINHDVLSNSKVQVRLGDARELLLIDNRTYDLIVSEPSNPFRAGISSLFTREFYEAVNQRLAAGGLFSQWVQGYEIDIQTMKTVYATLKTVFPHVETWQTSYGDYLLICSRERLSYSRRQLEQRLAEEPWKGALWQGWRVNSVEGIFSHYVANADFVNLVTATTNVRDHLCTDDRVAVEFGLLRTMGRKNLGMMQALQVEANSNQLQKPAMRDGSLDWQEVRDQNLLALTLSNQECKTLDEPDRGFLLRVAAHTNYRRENFRGFVQNWSGQDRKPTHPGESLMLAESFARFGAPETMAMLEPAQADFPGESQLILATYFSEIGSHTEALACFEKGFEIFRQRPFPVEPIIRRGMEVAMNLALKHPELAPRLVESLRRPFLLSAVNELRIQALVGMLPKLEPVLVRELCHALEPHVPWQDEFLTIRRNCYQATADPLLAQAEADLRDYLAGEPNRGGTDAFLK